MKEIINPESNKPLVEKIKDIKESIERNTDTKDDNEKKAEKVKDVIKGGIKVISDEMIKY